MSGAANGSLSAMDGLNSTASNGTRADMGAFQTLQQFDFLLLEFKLVGSALGIIYLGAHASLRRPPSASPPKSKKSGKKSKDDEEEEEEEEEEENNLSQGLELTDAIMFPLLAGIMLIGLYYLIQWLKDPAILSKILRYYMSFVSIASMVTMYAHGMDLFSSFTFPRYWRGWDGKVRKTEQSKQIVTLCDDAGNSTEAKPASTSPLPGLLSFLTPTKATKALAWKIRNILTRRWIFRLFVHGMGEEKANVKFATMLSIPLAAATAIIYFTTNTPFLSNLLGYAMCYCSLLILSPTDLLIGTLVLVGLFFYDIIMVFYTPYMVTVATTLDVPIKLQFKAAQRQSILGLGDIVIPGMFIAWALRLDLWLHYLNKAKYESTDLEIIEKTASGEVSKRSETKHKEIKAPYVNVKGNWGEGFWLRRGPLFLCGAKDNQLPAEIANARFSKPYFTATMVGYLLGMLVTLAMLLVFKRGQPALLYLVPGVLGSVYVTALARGEVRKIWGYTEDGSLDTKDVVVDLDGQGNPIKRLGQLKNGVVDTREETEKEKEEREKKEKEKQKQKDEEKAKLANDKKNKHVFFMSLEAPEDDL